MNLSKILLIAMTGISFVNIISVSLEDLEKANQYKLECYNNMVQARENMDPVSEIFSILINRISNSISDSMESGCCILATYPKTTIATLATCTIWAILYYKGFFEDWELHNNKRYSISETDYFNRRINFLQEDINYLKEKEPSEKINNDIVAKQAEINSLLKKLKKEQAYLAKIQNYLDKKEELKQLKKYL